MTNTAKPKHGRRFARTPKSDDSSGKPAGDGAGKAGAGSEPPESPKPKVESKTSQIIALLERPEGATLEEMIAATGWLPHTTRAALTGLKKKGHSITRDKRDDVSCYHIVKPA